MLDNSIAKHFSAEIKSLPFSDYMQALGLQNQLRDDIGFCVAVSNIWLYVVLNLIYSKSFNVKAKKTEKPYIASNIRMGNKQLLSSREKYIEKVKVQRRDFIDSDFNTLSMCEWIQDVEGYIIDYYHENNNILYNYLFMIIQYVITGVNVDIPPDKRERYDNVYHRCLQTVSEDTVTILNSIIPNKYVAPYMMNLMFVHIGFTSKSLKQVILGRENEECKSDHDCDGNLECSNNRCVIYN